MLQNATNFTELVKPEVIGLKFFLSPNKKILRHSGKVLKTRAFGEVLIKAFASNIVLLLNRTQGYRKIPIKFSLMGWK